MINFRYHIVSLTAVFLALIIGILMGTTVVSTATVDGLKANVRRAEARSAAVHRTNDRLTSELSERTRVADDIDAASTENVLAPAVDAALRGVPVLVITHEDVDEDLLKQTLSALGDSGADVDGTLVVDDRMSADGGDAERLRELLDVPARLEVHAAAARLLAVVLAGKALPGATLPGAGTTTSTAAPTTTEPSGDPDSEGDHDPDHEATTTTTSPRQPEPGILELLIDDGFVTFNPAEGRPADAPVLQAPQVADGTGYRYVVIGPSGTDADKGAFLTSLSATMARLGPVAQVAATGPKDPGEPGEDLFLEGLLDLDGVKGHLSTVDNLGSFTGSVAVVYALVDAGAGGFGSYGIGDTASAVLPQYVDPDDPGSRDQG